MLWKAMVPSIVTKLDRQRSRFETTHFSFEKLIYFKVDIYLTKISLIYYKPTPEVLAVLKLLWK